MIPKTFIAEWSVVAPWSEPRQIEQDLVITTALIKLYNHPILRETLAFRGGTALNKLIFIPALRYSEDIDLVQITGSPIGPTIDMLKKIMDPWLGKPKTKFPKNCVCIEYRITSEDGFPLKLKFEINTREHFAVMGFKNAQFSSSSTWNPGSTLIKTYHHEELLGTKLRALYQRRKGRDLYDLFMALTKIQNINHDLIIQCFKEYLAQEDLHVPKKIFLEAMEEKMLNIEFRGDILPLLSMQERSYNPDVAYALVRELLIEKL
jgi:predicted nucleotidyltransferase component of viral defense system